MSDRRQSPTTQLALPLATPRTTVQTRAAEAPEPDPVEGSTTSATVKAKPKTKRLLERLRAHLGPGCELVLTDNRSTLLSHSVKGPRVIARVHQMFLDGDDALFDDVARYMSSGHRQAGERIDAFVATRDHLLHRHAPALSADAGVGEAHDLNLIFADVNRRYFRGAVDAEIQWGKRGGRKRGRQRSITFGTYDERAHRITIHPVLDDDRVPRTCVARVVHHEMLHAVFPDERSPSGRRLVHGPLFKRAEALFEDAETIDAWFEANLSTLLRRAQNRTRQK